MVTNPSFDHFLLLAPWYCAYPANDWGSQNCCGVSGDGGEDRRIDVRSHL